MTRAERTDPRIIDASRRSRIARGSGTNPTQVSGLVSQFAEMQKMMKRLGGLGSKKAKKPKKAGKRAKGGGRVTPRGGQPAASGAPGGRVTPKGTKSNKSPLMLPGLDRFGPELDRLTGELDRRR
jgi:signal recognition particle subunit SRP54